jgi:hypothetical protein
MMSLKRWRRRNMSKGWESNPQKLEFLGKPEGYNYRCQDCGYEEEVMKGGMYS